MINPNLYSRKIYTISLESVHKAYSYYLQRQAQMKALIDAQKNLEKSLRAVGETAKAVAESLSESFKTIKENFKK